MPVIPEIIELKRQDIYPSTEMTADYIRRCYQNICALYEGLLGRTVPGASLQTFSGHDHGREGGGPLLRSSILTIDQFSKPIFTASFSRMGEVKTAVLGPRWVSPGLANLSAYTDVKLSMGVSGGSVDVWVGQDPTNKVRVDPTKEGIITFFKWVSLQNTILRSGQFSNMLLSIAPAEFQEETISVEVRGLDEVENYDSSLPDVGVRELPDAGPPSSGVFSYFGTDLKLDLSLIQESEPLDSFTLREAFFALNALFELLVNRSAPGASSHTIRGHEHIFFDVGNTKGGGRPVPRGNLFSGGGTHKDAWFKANCAIPDQWEYADNNPPAANLRRTNGTPFAISGIGTTRPLFEAYVSHGFTSVNPVVDPPYLLAWVYVTSDVGFGDADLRIFNHNSSELSEEINIQMDEWNLVRKIPCVGGEWNGFNVQVRRPSSESPNVYVTGLRLYEVYEQDGEAAAYIENGRKQLGVPREQTQQVPNSGGTIFPPVVVPP